jgi:hypothetical protein
MMDECESKDLKALRYRIAARQFEFALESCERLPREDQELLLREVAGRILQQLPTALQRKVPIAEFENESVVKVLGVEIKSS